MMAVIFALCCLGCAAVNDLVFRLYARKVRSRGTYVMIIGLVWTFFFLFFTKNGLSNLMITLQWGAISGIFSVVANILLIEAMSHQEAGVCSTIYRLNLVIVVAGAFLLLGENISILKTVGILFAIFAVWLFFLDFSSHGRNTSGPKAKIGIYLALTAALLRAGMGLSYKYALMLHADSNGLLIINGVFWIIGGILYAVWRERRIEIFNRKSWSYGLSSGILVVGIVLFMMLALKNGDASVVLPIAQMSFLGTCLLGAMILKERITLKKALGIIAGCLCILAISAGAFK